MDKVFIFKDVAGEYRWTRKSANGRIVADSSEGYNNKEDCVDMALRINKGAEFFVDGVSIAKSL
jgi:uncharacterized protein YegP (UPF0339 family)